MKIYYALGQFWYSILVILLTFFLVAGFTVGFVQHAIDQNNRPFCAIIVAITEPRPIPPVQVASQNKPATPYGEDLKKYAEALAKYNRDLLAYNQRVQQRLHAASDEYQCRQD